LIVIDAHCGYLLACRALRAASGCISHLPAAAEQSKLSDWWIKLGIAHPWIKPGRTEQNGRHERMHKTL
jgi:hypothetical protein